MGNKQKYTLYETSTIPFNIINEDYNYFSFKHKIIRASAKKNDAIVLLLYWKEMMVQWWDNLESFGFVYN